LSLPGAFSILSFIFCFLVVRCFVDDADILLAPRALLSVFAIGCIYFLSNAYFWLLNYIRNMKDERANK
ncbi:hypothetical protein ACNI4H_00850, partial [Klebsiella aerogenes]